jgi:UDP-N-acetylglucosamine 2-epimerase (non-hydrolysing)
MMPAKKILCIVGARPNFMKIAPIMRAFRDIASDVDVKLVHTGQHYDYTMNEAFFHQLQIPAPDVSLNVGSGTHAQQTAEIMRRFEPVLDEHGADCVLVVGDVNSTVACALVAAKKGVKVVHVEAGLRSRDRTMPEELNRLVTDQLSDRLYVTERDAIANLLAEGIPESKIVFTGNVMVDTLMQNIPKAVSSVFTIKAMCEKLGRDFEIFSKEYGLLTLHRPSNVDDVTTLSGLIEALQAISIDAPLVFPVHPRTRAKIQEHGFGKFLDLSTILPMDPQGYLEMLGLMQDAALVLTDSGGLQEESTMLGIPCLTLRENTERPITINEGTNVLVGTKSDAIQAAFFALRNESRKDCMRPEMWDGKSSERIVQDLIDHI